MRLGFRIFLIYLAIFAVCFYYATDWIWTTLRTRYLESVEEPLVDAANLIAAQVEREMARSDFSYAALQSTFSHAHLRPLAARIYGLEKRAVDLDLYLTDVTGRVLLDTRRPSAVGEDYSKVRDVSLTLAGQYGVRTSRRDPADPFSTVLYIGAPIHRDGKIAGVLTLAEPTVSIEAFLHLARPAFVRAGLLTLLVVALLSLAVSWGITDPIRRLARYAEGIHEGKHPPFPRLGRSEIADLGQALRRMQETLEGRRYAEEYATTLTHELKSPLSAIRGAAELLEDETMPPAQRERFVANVRSESERIARIVDRMLDLAKLENRRDEPEMEPVDLNALLRTVVESHASQIARRGLKLEIGAADGLAVTGNSFLLHQAVDNLLQNAIEWSPEGGAITVDARADGGTVRIAIADQGPGIPDFALDRIFDRFYSLARPDTGKKSTGLGLNFVREVARSHGGSIRVENRVAGSPEQGAIAELTMSGTGSARS